jgi:Uma2 family endonuclease
MTRLAGKPITKRIPDELHSGDRMTRQEFHRIYEKMPRHFKAELIGGTVYVASPLRYGHGTTNVQLGTLLTLYQAGTPGVGAAENTTVLLGADSEPQPDLFLLILPECGGQTRLTKQDYVEGAPELIVEVAYSSRAIDLNKKKEDYAQNGVWEYLVVSLTDQKIFWFDLRKDVELAAGKDGIIRVRSFPGLWIDTKALLSGNVNHAIQILKQGIDGPEHQNFVKRLAAKRK